MLADPVRLVAGLLHGVELEADRGGQGLTAEADVDEIAAVFSGHRDRERLVRLRGELVAVAHPDHPPPEHVDSKTQLRQNMCHHAVLLEAVAAPSAPHQFVDECLRAQVDHR